MKSERRHELKEDAFVSSMNALWAQCKKYRKQILISAAVVLGAALITTVIVMYSHGAEEEALATFADARHIEPELLDDLSSEEALKVRIDKLEGVFEKLEGTVAEPTYLVVLSQLLVDHGTSVDSKESLNRAVELLNTLIGKYPDARYIATAHMARGKALFALGEDMVPAVGDFQKVAGAISGGAAKLELAAQAKWYEGKCNERLGRYEEALAAYRECIELAPRDVNPNTEGIDWRMMARRDIRNIRSGKPSSRIISEIEKPEPEEKQEEQPEKEETDDEEKADDADTADEKVTEETE